MQLHSGFVDFNNEVCHASKIIIAESDPDTGLLTQQTLRLSPDLPARANKMPIITMSVASDWADSVSVSK